MGFSTGMLRGAALLAVLSSLAACGGFKRQSELECMERAMYFESNRSSRDGMIAVGEVEVDVAALDRWTADEQVTERWLDRLDAVLAHLDVAENR